MVSAHVTPSPSRRHPARRVGQYDRNVCQGCGVGDLRREALGLSTFDRRRASGENQLSTGLGRAELAIPADCVIHWHAWSPERKPLRRPLGCISPA